MSEVRLEHDCIQTTEHTYSARPDLRDQPLENPGLKYFCDGSSFVRKGQRKSGYAITSLSETIKAMALPIGTSAQAAKLMALYRALELSKGKRVCIFCDSHFAFKILHAYAANMAAQGYAHV